MNTQTKVLITGVAGLLGSHFSRYLLDKGYQVFGIDNLSGGYREFIDPRVKFYEIDLIDSASLEEIFSDVKPDYVYHFAAYAAEGLSPFIRNFNYSNNLICSVNVINQCINHDVKKIIFTSSMAVYGAGQPPFLETQRPNPIDPYGIAKYAVELDLHQAKEQFGLRYSIVRPHNVVGIRQNIWDKYRNVIGIWIRKVQNGENITIFGDGEQKRAFSDIKYYLEPFEKLMDLGDSEIFNIGADKERTIKEVASIVKEVGKSFGFDSELQYLEPRHEVKYAYSDQEKAKKVLGFVDGTDLVETITDMFTWAEKQAPRQVKQREYEVSKNIYDYWK